VPYCNCFDSEGSRCRLIAFPSISRSWFPALTILTVDLPLELRESPTCCLLDRLFNDANRAPICNTKLWYMCHYMYEIGCVGKGWEVMGASWLVASLEVQIHTPLGWRRAGPTIHHCLFVTVKLLVKLMGSIRRAERTPLFLSLPYTPNLIPWAKESVRWAFLEAVHKN
jgi:hypothetical protein